jgi:hypothetical protein
MDMAASFIVIDHMLHADQVPSWLDLGCALGLPDDRWRGHDPQEMPVNELATWRSLVESHEAAGVVWLGIAEFEDRTAVDPIGYAELGAEDFPRDLLWRADQIPSQDLSAFSDYARDPRAYDAYSYTVSLPWLGTAVRLHLVGAKVQAGFSDGDYLTFGPS